MIHRINVNHQEFSDVVSGKKTFIISRAINNMAAGDMIAINEYNEANAPTRNSCLVYVDYMIKDHPLVNDGCVAMSIKPCEVGKFDRPYHIEKRCADYSVPYATRGVTND